MISIHFAFSLYGLDVFSPLSPLMELYTGVLDMDFPLFSHFWQATLRSAVSQDSVTIGYQAVPELPRRGLDGAGWRVEAGTPTAPQLRDEGVRDLVGPQCPILGRTTGGVCGNYTRYIIYKHTLYTCTR